MNSSDIVDSARRTLRDDFLSTRAHDDEDFVDYVNRSIKVIVNTDSSASVLTEAIPLIQGNLQSIPVGGVRLLKLLHNDLNAAEKYRIGSRRYAGKQSIKSIQLSVLQAQIPNWAGSNESPITIISCFNEDDPTSFIVYPSNDGTGSLKATYSFMPSDVTEISSDPAGHVAIPDRFFNVITNMVMSFCLARDSENKELRARSMEFMQSAMAELGIKEAKDSSETPQNTVRM